MRRWLAPFVLGALLAPRPAPACGDKFLVVGRGTRFQQRATSVRTPAVLLYAPPASPLQAALGGIPVEKTLRRAGYAAAYATSARELDAFLGDAGADVVLAAAQDARLLAPRPGSPGPAVVPVLVDPSPSELAAAQREWGVVLATPLSRSRLLDALDEAFERRSATGDVALRAR